MLKALLSALFILLCSSLPTPAAQLSVFAASSLTETLREVAQRYEQRYPEDQLLLNFAGSQTLAMQIENGAPADLFISANQAVMEHLQNNDRVFDVLPLLGNRLVLASRADLPVPLTGVNDMTRAGLLLVIGNNQVPVGRYTRHLFAALSAEPAYGRNMVTRLEKNIISEENQVKAIVAKLLLGEADAGIVYQSDINSNKLIAIPLPEKLNPLAIYPLAKVKGGAVQSCRLYSFLQTDEAAAIFRRHGFLTGSEL